MQANDIINSLNLISEKLFKSVEGEVYIVLDKIINITPDILKVEPLKNIFYPDKINGIILIANSFLLFYITYYILSQLIYMYNGKNVESVYKFIIKITLTYVCVDNSYYICEQVLEIFSTFSDLVEVFGREISNQDITFLNLKENILSIEDFMKNDLFSLNGLIKGVISFGIITILINFSIRYVLIIFYIIISPFAIMALASNLTIGFFKTWIKLFISNMLIQVIVKILLIIPLMYKDMNSLMYKIILVGTIYLLYKITYFTKELFAKFSEK